MKIKLHKDREFCLLCSLLYIQFLNVGSKKLRFRLSPEPCPTPHLGILPMSLSLLFFIALNWNTINLHRKCTLESKFHEVSLFTALSSAPNLKFNNK